jgi:cyclophilin family peptidyl-prolyl cis-trans isomerase/HEAT repeat protein
MTNCRFGSTVLFLAAIVVSAAGTPAGAQPAPATPSVRPAPAGLRYRMLAAEDGRAATREEAAPLLEALAGPDSLLARIAVRALGRLEHPIFLPDIRRALADADPQVRAEAANALGQVGGRDVAGTLRILRDRLAAETDHSVLGALYATIGRVRHLSNEDRQATAQALTVALGADAEPVESRIGAARGLDSLARAARGTGFVASDPVIAALRREALGAMRRGSGEPEARVRRLALATLITLNAVDATFERATLDPDVQVRRLAVAGVAGDVTNDVRAPIVGIGLADPQPMVRYEALRVHGRHFASTDCRPEIEAAREGAPHIALLAIDLLASACPGDARATVALRTAAQALPAGPALVWLAPSHALVSLAQRDPRLAASLLAPFAGHAMWQVRTYAARAAGAAGESTWLEKLADDANANVREAAIAGLSKVRGHDADATFRKALDRPDYQVVMAAVAALKGTAAKEQTAAACLRALAAITAQHRDTSRDPRLALVDRIRETGSPATAAALRPYLSDFDPRVAALAADALTGWTGSAVAPVTTRLKTLPLPPVEELRGLPAALKFTMATGRSFVVRLFVDEFPVSAWRVVRLARSGAYNGLTFHRIVGNFIVQGGSPDANEFVGDGPFIRDEFNMRSQTRGTVGISSRGRDTGDGQFYVNLIDNPRLDHQYTMFGDVVDGMDVVDGIVEGDVIAAVEGVVLPAPPQKTRRQLPG